ncbi:MAG: uracil-DNA glycosylase [Gammaproteobacteria bacterium]
MSESPDFTIECRRCPRLASFLDDVRVRYQHYHARPVPAFGDPNPRLLIVGLAPGMHGANASGRPFTGDHAGILLYKTLFEYGFSSHADAVAAGQDLVLTDCRITNAVKCLPPQNKPLGSEVITCNGYLRSELAQLKRGALILALGGLAHSAVLRALDLKVGGHKFGHGVSRALNEGRWLISSYHCSRYNTQTRRLTPEMFTAVFAQIRKLMTHECT